LRILENRLILEAFYTISYKPTPKPYSKNQFLISGGIDIAGNLAGLIDKNLGGNGGQLFGIPFEQFARFDGEARYYRDISPTLRWANRFVGGLGIPYGNSKFLPQFKQYFAGGSTGIRAFRARTLGPGAYYADSVTRTIFGNSSFGDVKLEINSELRIKFNSLINGALFVDAGNIWTYNYNEDSFYGPEAVFSKDFYKQVAVGGGIGLRLDFSFLVFRIDLAAPFRKPWYPFLETPRNAWVFNEFNLRSKEWRRENLVLNIAVAYPF
jgi:outer membrane protein assembly factor BamA